MKKKLFSKRKSGYTIIETMIAISLFLVIITVGVDSLLNASLVHQKTQDMRSIIDNLSFIMDDMSRNIRTGYHFHCFLVGDPIPTVPASAISQPKSCTSGWALAFESALGVPADDNDQWVYYIQNGKIFRSTQGPYVASSFVQMTPDEVVVDAVSGFSVLGALPPPGDTQQPFIVIKLVGKINYKNVLTPFSLQSSVSQRLIDI